jgi:Rod binding domain-containing protein
MVDQINPLVTSTGSYAQLLPAARTAAGAKAQNEFLAIFYKEMLKQVFKTPNLSPLGEDEQANFTSNLNQDMLVDQLADQLAKKALAGQSWVVSGEGTTL